MVKISGGIKALHFLAVKGRKKILFLTSRYKLVHVLRLILLAVFFYFMDNSETQLFESKLNAFVCMHEFLSSALGRGD